MGLLSCVGPPVFLQVLRLHEPASAHGAVVGFHPRVDPLVLAQVPQLVEALPTLRALIGLLPCVDPLVLPHRSHLSETLPTLATLIRLLSRVDEPVGFQVAQVGEALGAFWAVVRWRAPCRLISPVARGARIPPPPWSVAGRGLGIEALETLLKFTESERRLLLAISLAGLNRIRLTDPRTGHSALCFGAVEPRVLAVCNPGG